MSLGHVCAFPPGAPVDNCVFRLSASAALTSMKRTLGVEGSLCWVLPPHQGRAPKSSLYSRTDEARVETEAQEGPATCPRGQSVCLEGAGPPAASKVTAFSWLLARQDASRGAERAARGQEGVKGRAGCWGGTSCAAASQVHCFLF